MNSKEINSVRNLKITSIRTIKPILASNGANKTIIRELISSKARSRKDLAQLKRQAAKEYEISFPSNAELLKVYHKLLSYKRIKPSKTIEILLRTRPVRSLSGIVNVSVLTKPYPCTGKCIYCPNQKGVPKSYLDSEPAVMRAILNKYHPYKQVRMRLRALKDNGHPIDKVELRIIGGTWSCYPKQYQTWFVKECFCACNDFDKKTEKRRALARLQEKNEKAKSRIVGLSIETRPDFITKKEIKRMRKLGITRVEMGVQSIYDNILKTIKRGHNVRETIQATKLLKDAGFKICYQMMPNLPGSNLEKDKKMFKELFSNPDFQPDFLKIYPTAIIKNTGLYKLWKEKKYKPYSEKELIKLIKDIKKEIPYYVRIQRITRDIPSKEIVAGPAKISNLRQIIAEEAKKEKWRCKCIRCREARGKTLNLEKLKIFRQDYKSSGGKEIFLSFEDKKRENIYSLLRLRIPSPCPSENTFPCLKHSAIIREVHTYGQLRPIHKKHSSKKSLQHKGLGKRLIKEAEKIAKKEFGFGKITVISGVGVRGYYSKLGYRLRDTYMIKELGN